MEYQTIRIAGACETFSVSVPRNEALTKVMVKPSSSPCHPYCQDRAFPHPAAKPATGHWQSQSRHAPWRWQPYRPHGRHDQVSAIWVTPLVASLKSMPFAPGISVQKRVDRINLLPFNAEKAAWPSHVSFINYQSLFPARFPVLRTDMTPVKLKNGVSTTSKSDEDQWLSR